MHHTGGEPDHTQGIKGIHLLTGSGILTGLGGALLWVALVLRPPNGEELGLVGLLLIGMALVLLVIELRVGTSERLRLMDTNF